eukprot:11646921-Alexandrium_andersonii.AAC.1
MVTVRPSTRRQADFASATAQRRRRRGRAANGGPANETHPRAVRYRPGGATCGIGEATVAPTRH